MRRAVPPRLPLASQRLIVITGKGGVGKTTVTAAFAQAAAAARRRVLAVEVGPGRLGTLLGAATVSHEPTRVGPRLAVARLESEAVLGDYVLSALRLRLLARRLLESTTFQVLAAAAPGLPELLVLHRVAGWLEERRLGRPAYDLVLLDAPASAIPCRCSRHRAPSERSPASARSPRCSATWSACSMTPPPRSSSW